MLFPLRVARIDYHSMAVKIKELTTAPQVDVEVFDLIVSAPREAARRSLVIVSYDLLICNGQVVDPTSTLPPQATDLAIDKGKICALARPGQLSGEAARVIDASGLYIFPGLIDPHVHINNRVAGSIRGGFQLTSLAAIHGGTTTFFDFTAPPHGTELLRSIEQQQHEAPSDGRSGLFFLREHLMSQCALDRLHPGPSG